MHKRIIFTLEQDADGYPPVGFESLWAIHQDDDRYLIDNIPFFTREATLGDIINTVDNGEELRYVRTLERSNNSLIRVVYYGETDPSEIRGKLEQLGCSTELNSDHQLIAVNIPLEVPLHDVQLFLQSGLDQDLWDYEEAIIRH